MAPPPRREHLAVTLEENIAEEAQELGFDLCGIAPLHPPRDAQRFLDWLAAGRNAGMEYLRRDAPRIVDPRRMLPEGHSLIVLGVAHSRPGVELAGGVRVARYAAGRDYHNVVVKRLRRLLRRLKRSGMVREARTVVDAGPLLERSHAEEAGLGFSSKAANLLHPRFGPWFFLGEVLVDTDLVPTSPGAFGSCGTCTACLDACPTQAITAPGVVDARLCISYHTIENPGRVPREVREKLDGWAFGCDVCSEVCPWGKKSPDLSTRFGTHALVEAGPIEWLRRREEFDRRAEGSSLRRPGRDGLARNAALALGSQKVTDSREVLELALAADPSPLVREAAGWSLARAFGSDASVRSALERAMLQDSDPECRSWLREWRGRCEK